jgi:predicted phage tail protein
VRSFITAIVLLLVLPGSALAAGSAPPTVSWTTPAAGPVAGAVLGTVEATDDVAITKVEFRVRGILRYVDTAAPYEGTFLSGFVADGPAEFKATAFDSDGQTAVATVETTIDNTKPSLTVAGPDKARFFPRTSQTWSFDAADGGTGIDHIRCSVQPMGNTPVFGNCTSAAAFVLNEQPEGFWTFSVRATDKAGNFAQQARDIKIDGTPPETTLLDGVEDGETTGEGTLTWDLEADENATFECRIAPAPFAPCSGEARHVVSGLAPGTYTFEARATDLTGNVDPTPVHITFTIVAGAAPSGAAAAPGAASLVTERVSDPGAPQIEVALSFSFTAARSATKLAHFLVKNIPAGATVVVKCPSGCARKTYRKVKRKGGQLLLTPVIKKQLAVGTEITVTVSKPGATAAVKVLKIRARKAPLVTTLCQPEGSSKPAAC